MIAEASRTVGLAAEVVKEGLVGLIPGRPARHDAAADRGDPLAQRRLIVETTELIGDREAHCLGQAEVLPFGERANQSVGGGVANAQSSCWPFPSLRRSIRMDDIVMTVIQQAGEAGGPRKIQGQSKLSQIGAESGKAGPNFSQGIPWISFAESSLFKGLRRPLRAFFLSPPPSQGAPRSRANMRPRRNTLPRAPSCLFFRTTTITSLTSASPSLGTFLESRHDSPAFGYRKGFVRKAKGLVNARQL